MNRSSDNVNWIKVFASYCTQTVRWNLTRLLIRLNHVLCHCAESVGKHWLSVDGWIASKFESVSHEFSCFISSNCCISSDACVQTGFQLLWALLSDWWRRGGRRRRSLIRKEIEKESYWVDENILKPKFKFKRANNVHTRLLKVWKV